MAAETKYGSGHRDNTAGLTVAVIDGKLSEGVLKSGLSHVQMTAGAETASAYEMTQVPSNAIVRADSKLYHDATGTSVTCSITAVNPRTTSVGPTALATGLDISAAGSKDVLDNIGVENYGKELWEMAGFTSDPGEMLTIRVNRTGAGTVLASDLVVDSRYSIVG